MSNIVTEERDGVVVLRIDRPPVNALDVDTLVELSDGLDSSREEGHDALVLTGAGRVFSAGADLRRVLDADADYAAAGIAALSRAFETLFTHPHPVVAAVNGAALAGGAILTSACDHRMIASGAVIGAIELRAGVPFPAWALEVLRYAVDDRHFQEITYFGEAYEANDALSVGLVDEVISGGQVVDRAVEVARRLGSVPRASFELTKRSMREPTAAAARAATRWDGDVADAWASSEVRDAIREQLARLGAR